MQQIEDIAREFLAIIEEFASTEGRGFSLPTPRGLLRIDPRINLNRSVSFRYRLHTRMVSRDDVVLAMMF